MTDPKKPVSWLVQDARSRIDPTRGHQFGPQSPVAPSDATAVRSADAPKTLREKLRMLRMTIGGGAEGVARLPVDAAALATLPITAIPRDYELRTVGRGQVVSQPRTRPPVLAPAIEKLLALGGQGASILGDEVGGVPQTESEQDFRDIGSFAGNLAAWERLPFAFRALRPRPIEVDLDVLTGRALPPGYAKGRVLREIPPSNPVPSRVAYIDRPHTPQPYTGPVTQQEFFDDHLRRLGLLPRTAR